MVQKQGFLMRIRRRLFSNEAIEPTRQLLIEEPEQSLEEELIQGTDMIDLDEQLRMIRIVDEYAEQFVFPGIKKDPSWDKGFALQNEIFVTLGEEPVYRSNMEVFFQDSKTGEKKIVYLVSLVRFADDDWRVFQLKGVIPLLD
jgi:hypothetical protein